MERYSKKRFHFLSFFASCQIVGKRLNVAYRGSKAHCHNPDALAAGFRKKNKAISADLNLKEESVDRTDGNPFNLSVGSPPLPHSPSSISLIPLAMRTLVHGGGMIAAQLSRICK
jgi:hypothetical protein